MVSSRDKEEIDNMGIIQMGNVLSGGFDSDDHVYFFDDAYIYLKVRFNKLGGWKRFSQECSDLRESAWQRDF